MTRGTALRFGALLHDIGKPATRGERGGYVTFIGHDREGAEMVGDGLPAAAREPHADRATCSALTLHHLRLGFLVHEAPLPPRRVHEYLRATEPVAADVTLLTVADRLSARGSGPFATEEAIEAHLEPGPRDARRRPRLAPRRPAAAAAAAATSSPPSSASPRGRSSASCSPSSRRPSTRARSARREEAVAWARRLRG